MYGGSGLNPDWTNPDTGATEQNPMYTLHLLEKQQQKSIAEAEKDRERQRRLGAIGAFLGNMQNRFF